MDLIFHGGLCCGVKTIKSFPYQPADKVGALKAITIDNRDANGGPTDSTTRFFHEAAPLETGEARLRRYVDYCKARRPSGAIELILANYSTSAGPSELNVPANWEPLLFELGFEKKASWFNSNSKNICNLYYLTYEDGVIPKICEYGTRDCSYMDSDGYCDGDCDE